MNFISRYQRQIIVSAVSVFLSLLLVTTMSFAATYIDVDSVGVATDTPGAALGIKGAGIFEGFLSADYFTSTSTASSWLLGNLGLGTTTPGTRLDVHGDSIVAGNLNVESGIKAQSISATSTTSGFGTSSPFATLSVEIPSDGSKIPAFVVSDFGTSAPALAVTADGNVLLGTASSTDTNYSLQIYRDLNNFVGPLAINTTSGNVASAGYFAGKDAVSLFLQISYRNTGGANSSLLTVPNSGLIRTGTGAIGGLVLVSGESTSPIIFGTGGGGFGNERLRINSTGNIGIKNHEPAELLDVAGRIAATNEGELYLSNGFTATSSIRGEYGLLGFGSSTPFGQISIEASSTVAGSNTPIFVIGDQGTATPFIYVSGNNGNIGIGTDSPSAVLAIDSTKTVPALMINAGGTGDGNVAISVEADDVCVDGSADTGCALNDIAELYPTTDQVDSGDLVMIDVNNPTHLKKASASNENLLAGIVSSAPAIVLEGNRIITMGGQYKSQSDKLALALAGRVPAKVNLEGGEIHIGDPITVSSVAGVGKKATESGNIVGYALSEPVNGKVIVLVRAGVWLAPSIKP